MFVLVQSPQALHVYSEAFATSVQSQMHAALTLTLSGISAVQQLCMSIDITMLFVLRSQFDRYRKSNINNTNCIFCLRTFRPAATDYRLLQLLHTRYIRDAVSDMALLCKSYF